MELSNPSVIGITLLVSLFLAGAIWAFVVEPRTDIYEPTLEIIKLLKKGDRFEIRPSTAAEIKECSGFVDFAIVDIQTGHKTLVGYSHIADRHLFTGDLSWMTPNEQKLTGKVADKIFEAQLKVEREIKEAAALLEDAARREIALTRYK